MSTTKTSELRQVVPGQRNVSVMMQVIMLEERIFPTKVEGKPDTRRLVLHLINDEEELLKLLAWGGTIDGLTAVIKQGGLYEFTGLYAKHPHSQSLRIGHLDYELTFRQESRVKQVRSAYVIRGLPLSKAVDIDPATSWRIRCRGKVVKTFEHYYERDTGLCGDIVVGNIRMQVVVHAVPSAYLQSFAVGTEVEFKGHIAVKGALVELDVQWPDVCVADRLPRGPQPVQLGDSGTPARAEECGPSYAASRGNSGSLGNVNKLSSSAAGGDRRQATPNASPASESRDLGNVNNEEDGQFLKPTLGSTPKSSRPFGLDVPGYHQFVATITKQFAFDDFHEAYAGTVMVTDRRPVVPLRVYARNLHEVIRCQLAVGEKLVVKGRVRLEGRTLTMMADKHGGVLPEGFVDEKSLDYSVAANINGCDSRVHRIRCKIVGEFVLNEQQQSYVGNVVVDDDDEVVTIVLIISEVPDDSAHLLHHMAELEAVGRVTGNEFEMEMKCSWTKIIMSTAGEQPVNTLPKDNVEHEAASPTPRSSPSESGDHVQHLGNVDYEGKPIEGLVLPLKKPKEEKQDNPQDFESANLAAGMLNVKSQDSLKRAPTDSIDGGANKNKKRLRRSPGRFSPK